MQNQKPKWKQLLIKVYHWNWHIILAVGFLLFLALILIRIFTYGERVDRDFISTLPLYVDSDLDLMFPPIIPSDAVVPEDDGVTTIVTFGNAPFADDKESPDGLANMIAEQSGATVYNCAVSGSYLSAKNPRFQEQDYPMDAWSFYWMTTLITNGANDWMYQAAFDVWGADTPQDARDAYETMTSIDFMKVDIICVLYDASDYLAGRPIYSDTNDTDIMQFAGNMQAGLDMLEEYYPHIRVIVLSPTYAFAVDEEGEYVSSDIMRYGQDVLSSYAIMQGDRCYQSAVTYVDLLYAAFDEDNATKYLTDNLHLNHKGREAVTHRFLFALNYFD
jgi:hypothetical protein